MKNYWIKYSYALSDELIIVISLIIGLLVTASLILFLVKKISENKYQRTRRPHALMVDHGGHVYRCCIYQL